MDLEFASDFADRAKEIEALYLATFTASEGAEEGTLIHRLVRELLSKTHADDLFVFSCWVGGDAAGCIIFSRLTFEQDNRVVFILAPVAVKTELQGQGIGQQLLRYGLDELQKSGVDVAITYGDPNYYSKVGFKQISEGIAQPPLQLDYPRGWLAQSLTDRALDPIKGPSRCVEALNSPDYW